MLTKRRNMPTERRRRLGKLNAVKKGSDQRYKQIYVTCLYDQSHEHRLVGVVCLKANLDQLPLEMVLLDFYHASEHVGVAAVQTGADKQWLEQTLHVFRHEGFDPFFQRLLDWRTPLRGAKRKQADALIAYIAVRKEMIRYEQCDARGLDVGSGPMESMCGVTTDRIKGRGRRPEKRTRPCHTLATVSLLVGVGGLWLSDDARVHLGRYWLIFHEQEGQRLVIRGGPDEPLRTLHYGRVEPYSWVYLFLWGFAILLWALRRKARKARRLQRRRAGLCAECGYDLRASADRCPECGSPVQIESAL